MKESDQAAASRKAAADQAANGATPLPPGCRILFIGGGNMAGAMISGLVAAGISPAQVAALDPAPETRDRLRERHGIAVFADPAQLDATLSFDAIVLAVKPQQAEAALAGCRGLFAGNPQAVLISVAAGLRIAAIVAASGGHARVVRAMPNTPALIGHGIAGFFAPASVDASSSEIAAAVLGATGAVVRVAHENLLDTVTAVSGSGPAYAFYLMEAMIDAGIAGGLDAGTARTLALHTVKGAALLALASEEPPTELRRRVTSPGGTTAAAIEVLDRQQVRASLGQAIQAAAARSRQLSEPVGPSNAPGSAPSS
ncbi:MAG: pyrroline-5-carboxylate reductase [Burkholderiaceae bacterium]|nr:pyrroline-5-carboxylate reductase [Burkholderiaceae bacterium]